MHFARALVSRGALSRHPLCQASASQGLSRLRLVASGRLSSSLAHVGATRTKVAGSGAIGAREAAEGLVSSRAGGRILQRERQQVRSLGLFADGGGGVSDRTLKLLEKQAAATPSDARAEVCSRSFFLSLYCFFSTAVLGQRNLERCTSPC